MLSRVFTGSLYGLESELITVETDLSAGLPALTLVGLPDLTVKESKERIRSAIINSNYKFPAKRITINLAPASTKKEGTHFDLPIAIGILASIKIIDSMTIKDFAFIGELSLDGKVNHINGALPLVIGIRNKGIKKIVLPISNAKEVSIIDDVEIYPISKIDEIVDYFLNKTIIKPYKNSGYNIITTLRKDKADFSDVSGQETVKRALQIGVAASHNILMIGPPGAGKTMVARRIPSIMPPMTYEEKLEVTKLYSIAGELSERSPMILDRPFRAPHHTISAVAMVGGGSKPRPGEVSLAHYGVLFLDEFPEFNRKVIEMLRQPMEDEKITINRISSSLTFPSKIMVVAAMNPCPCGYYGDSNHECTCKPYQIHNYLSKISGPLLDRMDIQIEIMPVNYDSLIGNNKIKPRNSEEMRKEIERARTVQLERYKKEDINYNSQLNPNLIKKYCILNKESKDLMKEAFYKFSLSARAYNKIIKLSRTIADIDGINQIEAKHIAEAIQYRSLDKIVRGI
ncbi:YifB family Mg chelatase-like AAA ATPase [Anaerovorax odorimutans]|uniref:YifB family Mg chelatase-like AAA ATPase n=1 Tax=Anaerovorax odorimutans TaxID=109327 RepID=UPI00041125BC|nr:YifB family Mg chelatase-like AAA ATPase [Anaerovorax odorimutans]